MKTARTLIICLLMYLLAGCNTGQKGAGNEVRKDIVSLNVAGQRDYLKGLSSAEKASVWKLKLEDTVKSEALSDDEKAAIKVLKDAISPEAYEEGTPEQEKMQAVAQDLEKTLMEQYGWDELKLFRYLMTIMTEKEIEAYNEIHPIKI